MTITISALDPDSTGPSFDQALALWNRLTLVGDPDGDPTTEAGLRSKLRGNQSFEKHALVATHDGDAVGAALVRFHHIEGNEDKGEATLGVHPDRRREGVGAALVAAVADLCEANGRTSLIVDGVVGPDTEAFWPGLGAPLCLTERLSRSWIADVDPDLMATWISRRTERAGSYRLESFRGRTPEHLLRPVADLTTAMNDAPTEDLDLGDDIWTPDDVRAVDDYFASAQVERWAVLAFDPDDQPAGITVVQIPTVAPRFSHQGDTVVLDSHRGRGVGRWLKAEMWTQLRTDAPDVAALDTTNAGTNAPMLAINEAMGFRPVHDIGVWQAPVSDLRAALRRRQRSR